ERSSILRLKSRALSTLQKDAEALDAARKSVDEAAAIADAARKNEEHPASLMLLAELSGKDAEARYKELAALYPQSRYGLAARFKLALMAGEAGRTQEALETCEALLQALPNAQADSSLASVRGDALFAAAEFAFRKPDFKKAEEYFKS